MHLSLSKSPPSKRTRPCQMRAHSNGVILACSSAKTLSPNKEFAGTGGQDFHIFFWENTIQPVTSKPPSNIWRAVMQKGLNFLPWNSKGEKKCQGSSPTETDYSIVRLFRAIPQSINLAVVWQLHASSSLTYTKGHFLPPTLHTSKNKDAKKLLTI